MKTEYKYSTTLWMPILGIFSLFLLTPPILWAQPASFSGRPDVLSSIVRLTGTQTCATGFLLPGGVLVTNAHVSRSICRFGECKGMGVQYAHSLGSEPTESLAFKTITVVDEYPSIDVAMLKISPPPALSHPITVNAELRTVKDGTPLVVIGFPACQELTISQGIAVHSNAFQLETTSTISKGSSGSPILSPEGELLGIVSRLNSTGGALRATLFGGSDSAKGIPWKVANEIFTLPPDESIQRELEIATTFYRDSVRGTTGIDRWIKGIEFFALVQGIADRGMRISSSPDLLRLFLWIAMEEGSLKTLPPAPTEDLLEGAYVLALAYAIEYGGLQGTFLPIDSEEVRDALVSSAGSPRVRSAIRDLVEAQLKDPYPGFLHYSMKLAILFLAVVTVWLWSLGWVFGSSRGSVIKRLAKMTVVAICIWPLSLIVWRLCGRKG